MHKRGIRVLPGGDYGFAWTPHGENAKDLEYFVKYLGMTPMEAIVSATRWGGQIMMQGKRARARSRRATSPTCCWWTAIRSPTSRSCRTATKLLAIMKDGVFHKEPGDPLARGRAGAQTRGVSLTVADAQA